MRTDPNYWIDLDGPHHSRRERRLRRAALALLIAFLGIALGLCAWWWATHPAPF